MVTAARDRLARTLRDDAQAAFSVKFPVTPARVRKLLGFGQPARFGRGEQTLTAPDVRDTWEIPTHLVRAE